MGERWRQRALCVAWALSARACTPPAAETPVTGAPLSLASEASRRHRDALDARFPEAFAVAGAVTDPPLDARATVWAGSGDAAVFQDLFVTNGVLTVAFPRAGRVTPATPPGEGWIAVEGYAPTALRWGEPGADGLVQFDNPRLELRPPAAHILGVVEQFEGAVVRVAGCGSVVLADEGGRFDLAVISAGEPCGLRARREAERPDVEGYFALTDEPWGPRIDVDPASAHHVRLLAGPPSIWRLGVVVRDDPRGLVVVATHRSDDLLREGDVLISARGEPLAGMDLAAAVATLRASGAPGDVADLVVLREGERVMVRAPLVLERIQHRSPDLKERAARPRHPPSRPRASRQAEDSG